MVQEWKDQAVISRRQLRGSLKHSFVKALGVAAIALVGAGAVGAIHYSLPWNMGKVLQTVGGGIAIWSTFFALGEPQRTWDRNTLAEVSASFYVLAADGSGRGDRDVGHPSMKRGPDRRAS
jgi:hypothetical protein